MLGRQVAHVTTWQLASSSVSRYPDYKLAESNHGKRLSRCYISHLSPPSAPSGICCGSLVWVLCRHQIGNFDEVTLDCSSVELYPAMIRFNSLVIACHRWYAYYGLRVSVTTFDGGSRLTQVHLWHVCSCHHMIIDVILWRSLCWISSKARMTVMDRRGCSCALPTTDVIPRRR